MTGRNRIAARVTLLAAATALLLIGCGPGKVSDDNIVPISLMQLTKLRERDVQNDSVLLLVDPRPPTAFSEGHIPGARNLQIPDVHDRFGKDPEISRHDNIVVYGDDPASAAARAMTKRLITIGYGKKKVKMFEGGLREWIQAGFPIETIEDQDAGE